MRFALSVKLWIFALALFLGSAAAHGQVNPNINIKWPPCSGGATVYNIVTNTCVANGSGNGVQVAATPPVLVNGGAGPVSSGIATVSCPTCGNNLTTFYQPATSGQYALVFAHSCAVGNPARASCTNSSGVQLAVDSTITWSDYTLPSYITQANVTAVYIFAISQSSFANYQINSFEPQNLGGGGGPTACSSPTCLRPYDANTYPLAQQTLAMTSLPTDYSAIALTEASSNTGTGQLDIPLIGLEVHYTGTAPPTSISLEIQPPLYYDSVANTLGISPSWPNLVYTPIVAALPASNGIPFETFVTDGATTTDCSTGGGADLVLCSNNGSGYTGYAIGGGSSGNVPLCADTSGSGTAQSCTTSPTFTPVAGSAIVYSTTTANSGTGLTINVNSLGAQSVAKWQSTTTLAAGDVAANRPVLAVYDGTRWNLSTIANPPAGATGVSEIIPGTNVTCSPNVGGNCTGNVTVNSSGGSGGCMSSISQTLGTAAASITFNSIPGTCNTLILDFLGQSLSGSADYLELQVNGDASGDYVCQFNFNGGPGNCAATNSGDGWVAGLLSTNNSGDQGGFSASAIEMTIPGYTGTAFAKSYTSTSYRYDPLAVSAGGTWYKSGSLVAITSIVIFPGSGSNFAAGTTVTLSGR